MESEWRLYLKEHAPELYEQMKKEVAWAGKWRDDKIKRYRKERIDLQSIFTTIYRDIRCGYIAYALKRIDSALKILGVE